MVRSPIVCTVPPWALVSSGWVRHNASLRKGHRARLCATNVVHNLRQRLVPRCERPILLQSLWKRKGGSRERREISYCYIHGRPNIKTHTHMTPLSPLEKYGANPTDVATSTPAHCLLCEKGRYSSAKGLDDDCISCIPGKVGLGRGGI